MNLRWLISSRWRQAADLRKRVRAIYQSQIDILAPLPGEKMRAALAQFETILQSPNSDRAALDAGMRDLGVAGEKYLKPYPAAALRENIDVIFVALTVALAIRTFFFQPMAIPTGSMQPTLNGITHQDLRGQTVEEYPNALTQIWRFAIKGEHYFRVTALEDGNFEGFEEPHQVAPFVQAQRFRVGGQIYQVRFPPDSLIGGQYNRSGLMPGQSFKKGQDIIRLKVTSGDRLFANRITYNFSRPKRGDIVIFESTGIPMLTQNTHYIKRLIGLPGETLRIGDDRHVVVDGVRLDASTPKFANIYSFSGPPLEDHYSGHVNSKTAQLTGRVGMQYAPLFPDGNSEFKVRPNHFFVCGDNTMNSYDSRFWGDFPTDKVIGKHAFVFWPFSSHFGWSAH